MKRDEVIRMAREAGAYIYGEKEVKEIMLTPESIERFAELVAKQERDACAKVCEAQLETGAHIRCATAIRARDNKE